MADRMSGKSGSMKVGAVGGAVAAIAITDWEFDEQVGLPDASDSLSGDYMNHVTGRKSATCRFSGNVYDDASPLPEIAVGTDIAAELYLDGTLKHTIAEATIETLKTNAPVKSGDPVTYEGTFKVQGSWTPAS